MIKKHIKKSLRKVGLELQRIDTGSLLDFTKGKIDPITAIYESSDLEILIKIPLKDCLQHSYLAFPCTPESCSPYTRTLIGYACGKNRSYAGSPLEAFYRTYQPASVAELMGIEEPNNKVLLETAPNHYFMPWGNYTPKDAARDRGIDVGWENREHGMKFGIEEGDQFFGPVSKAKGELEFRRTVNIYEALKAHGLRINYNGVDNAGVICLFSEKENRIKYMVKNGQHRLAALAALGYESAVVQIRRNTGLGGIVRRNDAERWPAVHKGFLKKNEAIMVFDRIFEGRQPNSYQRAF